MLTRLKGSKWTAARRKARRALAAISDEEDAEIRKAAAADPDNPPLDDRSFVAARPAADVAPDLVRESGGRRAPRRSRVKALVSLRLDREVIEHFQGKGRNWQAQINDALRKVAKL
jgi:uncharacterized protein (DUF4415 family)